MNWLHGRPKTVDTLRSNYHLDGMLSLESLRTLHVHGSEYGTGGLALTALAGWLRQEYGILGRRVNVITGYPRA